MKGLLIGPMGPNQPINMYMKEFGLRGHDIVAVCDIDCFPAFVNNKDYINVMQYGKPVSLSKLYNMYAPDADFILVEESQINYKINFKHDSPIPVVYVDRECVHGPSIKNPDFFIYRSDLQYSLLKAANPYYCFTHREEIIKMHPRINTSMFCPNKKTMPYSYIGMSMPVKKESSDWIVNLSLQYIDAWHGVLRWIDNQCYHKFYSYSPTLMVDRWRFPEPVSFERYREILQTSQSTLIFANPLAPVTRRIMEAGLSKTVPIVYVHDTNDRATIRRLNDAGFINEVTCLIARGANDLRHIIIDFRYDEYKKLLTDLEILTYNQFTYASFVDKIIELVS